MFVRPRQTPQRPPERHVIPPEVPSFRPAGAKLLLTREEVESSLQVERAIVFISVEWSGQERRSRVAFTDLLRRLEDEHGELKVYWCVVSEYSEDIWAWYERLMLPASASTGYGAVTWLQRGHVVGMVPDAAEVGVERLVSRTLGFWGTPPVL